MKKLIKTLLGTVMSISLLLYFTSFSYADIMEDGSPDHPYNISGLVVGTLLPNDNNGWDAGLSIMNDTVYILYVSFAGGISVSDVDEFPGGGTRLDPGESARVTDGYQTSHSVLLVKLPLVPSPVDEEPEENTNYLTPFEDELEALVESFNQTPPTEPTTVTWDKGTALPLDVMETLKENPSISLLFDFEYEGVKHTVLIPAGRAIVDESIPWYGPLWLLQTFGEYDPNSNGAYTVQSGDTLGDIAHSNGMTIEELLKKNPQISDINLIYPGEVINL